MTEHPYGWLSLLPPIVAIVLAIATRRIVLSLVLGIFAGALLMSGGDVLTAIEQTWETHLWNTLINPSKQRVFTFTLFMGAMIGVITRSGGMQGLIDLISPWASNRRRGQLSTWFLGLLIFFDDYANTILLGSTLRPICDRLKISREKLAYLVDSTAAPVAGLALVSTWVAVEIDFIQTGLDSTPANDLSAFSLFVASIPYRFYVLAALVLVPLTALFDRDLGAMVSAEKKCVAGEETPGRIPDATSAQDHPRTSAWYNAVLPIALTLGLVIYLIYQTGSVAACDAATKKAMKTASETIGMDESALNFDAVTDASTTGDVAATIIAIRELGEQVSEAASDPSSYDAADFDPKLELREIVGSADSSLALQYGALAGLALAMALPLLMRLLTFDELLEGAFAGAKVVLPAVAILWSASAMSRMTTDESLEGEKSEVAYEFQDFRLYTAAHLTTVLTGEDAIVSANYLPTVVFALAAFVAFCTGTSWGTMGILVPMVVQTAFTMLGQGDAIVQPNNPILLGSIAGVLAGAVFGDHCSPISDTTVLSSQSSGCDHLAHVWTQMPYALTAATVSVVLGTLPLGFGVSVWILLPLQVVALICIVRFVGTRIVD